MGFLDDVLNDVDSVATTIKKGQDLVNGFTQHGTDPRPPSTVVAVAQEQKMSTLAWVGIGLAGAVIIYMMFGGKK